MSMKRIDNRKNISITKQEFKNDSNPNIIMERYLDTGLMGIPLNQSVIEPFYGDFTKIPNLQEAMDIVNEATEMWDRLPARTRVRFENRPELLVEFVQNERNRNEAIELGLIPRPNLDEVLSIEEEGKKIAEKQAKSMPKKIIKQTNQESDQEAL